MRKLLVGLLITGSLSLAVTPQPAVAGGGEFGACLLMGRGGGAKASCRRGRLLRDVDLDLTRGPAALETAAALAGVIVQHDM